MDRWREVSNAGKLEGETALWKLDKIKLYDGEKRTDYDDGTLEVTSHRLLWIKNRTVLSMALSGIQTTQYEEGGFLRSDKITINFIQQPGLQGAAFTKIGGKSNMADLQDLIDRTVREQKWNVIPVRKHVKKEIRSGISGIEKKLHQKSQKDNQNISKAFEDLDRLMEMAKPMVNLAKSISTKIRDKQGEITEDETVQFKSYLLSLGIDDPVTKDSAGSDKKYYQGLAKEMFLVLDQHIQDAGGMMTLTDAFVRVNRARGLELVSPDDVLEACKTFKETNLPLSLHTFPSGVMVLKSSNLSEEDLLQKIVYFVEAFQKISTEQLAKELKISILLAGERLEAAASEGHIVVDKCISGVEYYPNQFLKT